jgi:SAM-dependent methyltransferase
MGVFEEFTNRQRETWAAGDWPDLAQYIQEVSDVVVEQLGVGEGDDHLDVATGSGNAAITGAERGAKVVGLDLVPQLLEAARRRAAAAGLEVEWVEGDAASLPFEDDSFDRVTSVFGSMFAPEHERAAAELVRVTRPGGAVGVTAWTPEGLNGQMLATLGRHLPPPPPELKPPILWGDEDHVRGLFQASDGVDVSCERRTVSFEADSTEDWVDYFEDALGPVVMARAALEPQGKWDEARSELVELYERYNEAKDGGLRAPAEYLLTTVRLAG